MAAHEHRAVRRTTSSAKMPEGMGGLNEKMGIEIIEISAERVVGTMPVDRQHPAVRAAARRRVGACSPRRSARSARRCTPHPDRLSVGVDINATHHRAATSGIVTGSRRDPPRPTMATYEVVITDEDGKRVCTVADHLRADAAGAVRSRTRASALGGGRLRRSERRMASTWVS